MADEHPLSPFVPLTIFVALSLLAVSLRFYVRICITHAFAVDDWCLGTAQIFAIIGCGTFLAGRARQKDYEPGSVELFKALSTIEIIALGSYLVAGCMLKLSLALFFVKLAQRKWQRIMIMTTVAVYCTYLTSYMLLYLFRCGFPIVLWKTLYESKCVVSWHVLRPFTYMTAISNCLADWMFAINSIFVVLHARKLETAARISACVLIALAFSGSIISVARIPFVVVPDSPRFLQDDALILSLSIFETAIGIIAISLATLKPLVGLWKAKARALERRLHRARSAADFDGPQKRPVRFVSGSEPETVFRSLNLDTTQCTNLGVLPDPFDMEIDSIDLPASCRVLHSAGGTMAKKFQLEVISEVECFSQGSEGSEGSSGPASPV